MCVSPRLRGRTDAHFNVLVNALHYYALPAPPSLPQSAISPPIPAAVRSRHAVTPEYDELLITPKENLDQEEEEMEEEMGERDGGEAKECWKHPAKVNYLHLHRLLLGNMDPLPFLPLSLVRVSPGNMGN